jgi:P22_AR N-terminal domain
MEQARRVRKTGKIIQQATARFEDAEIIAVLADDGLIYGSLPHLCRSLGLDGPAQQERIEEHVVLVEGLLDFDLVISGRVLTTACLKSSLIPLWLALVPVKRLRADKQERVLLFQRRAADALNRLFGPGDASTTGLVPASSQEAAQQGAYEEGLAIARMASEQALIAAQLAGEVEARVIALESAMEARLIPLEQRLLPTAVISEEQAGRISDLVKQAALRLGEKAGGGNFFGTVYGQLYRHCGVTSYKNLTQEQYPRAVAWLEKIIRDEK